MTMTLREIGRENWEQCVRLEVAPEQERFVASNAVSLAQSKYEPEWTPLALYDGEEMVGRRDRLALADGAAPLPRPG